MAQGSEHSEVRANGFTTPILLALSLGPGLLLLLGPEALRPLHELGRTLVLSLYFLIDAALLLAIMALYARHSRQSLGAVIGYNRPIPIVLFLALAALGAAWAIGFRDFAALPLLSDVSRWAMGQAPWWPSLFGRMPGDDALVEGQGAAIQLAITVFAGVSVVAASFAQSLYFRGFLLSRMERFGWTAPVLNNLLFVAYHLGSPFFWPQFLLFTFIWALIAYATKNVWSQAVAHGAMNGYQYGPAIWSQVRAFGGGAG